MKLWRLIFLLLISPAVFLATSISISRADEGSAPAFKKPAFTEAIGLFNSLKYEEAASGFALAKEETPVIGDYALFFRARALKELDKKDLALESLNALLDAYPSSPLIRKAKKLRISLSPDEALPPLLKEYVEIYPEDEEISFKYALSLKEAGKPEEADPIFAKLYTRGGKYSVEAGKGLSRAPLISEMLARAENLLKNLRFDEAGKELEMAALLGGGAGRDVEKNPVLMLQAKSLFMRKRYPEAAEKYLLGGDMLEAARSYYRAGDEASLDKTLEGLVSSGEDRACWVLLAYAAKKRRSGEYEDAIKLLEKSMGSFPARMEETLWELGWLHYMKKDYGKAFAYFSQLEFEYENPAYKYWKARAMGRLGGDASDIYRKLASGGSYYSVLARIRFKEPAPAPLVPASYDPAKAAGAEVAGMEQADMTRVNMLLEAGLSDEAVSELSLMADKSFEPRTIMTICERLKQLGAYRKAILIAAKLPPELQSKEILYPAAFWREVEGASAKNDIDPYLVLSVMREESKFQPDVSSPAGALGLMQLMPDTAQVLARALKITLEGTESIYRVENNIELGTFYLKKLLSEFGSVPLALAAYNAGESTVKGWAEAGKYEAPDEFIEDIPYVETKNYVKRIIGTYYNYRGGEAVEKGIFPTAPPPEKTRLSDGKKDRTHFPKCLAKRSSAARTARKKTPRKKKTGKKKILI
jgi:soluble lytic murein transglycosylase